MQTRGEQRAGTDSELALARRLVFRETKAGGGTAELRQAREGFRWP